MRNLIILGSGRSGTSLAAGCFAKSGYFMGANLYEPRESNPKGFFESPEVNLINELILDTIPPERFTFRPVLHNRWTAAVVSPISFPPIGQPIEQIRQVVSREPYCFKDPRFSYTLPVWRPYLTRAAFLCVFRDPADTALSMVKEVDSTRALFGTPVWMTDLQALETWKAIYTSILMMDRTCDEWLFVHYDQILDGSALEAMEAFSQARVDRCFPEARFNRSVSASRPEYAEIRSLYTELCRLAGYRTQTRSSNASD